MKPARAGGRVLDPDLDPHYFCSPGSGSGNAGPDPGARKLTNKPDF
jgi:hypothetical protein